MLCWPQPATPSPDTMGRTEPGMHTGRCGHRAVAMSVLTTQTSRRGLISSRPGALKEWLWSARICPSSPAGTEHGRDASLWDERCWKLQSSCSPPGSSGTSPLSLGAAGRGLRLQAGDKGWPGSCWKDGLPIHTVPVLRERGRLSGTFGSSPAVRGGIGASCLGPWESRALPPLSGALPAAPSLELW